jgi:hypothetical protein
MRRDMSSIRSVVMVIAMLSTIPTAGIGRLSSEVEMVAED